MKTLAEMTEAELIQQARNYGMAIGRDPNRIVTGEDALKYLDHIAQEIESDRAKGYNCD